MFDEFSWNISHKLDNDLSFWNRPTIWNIGDSRPLLKIRDALLFDSLKIFYKTYIILKKTRRIRTNCKIYKLRCFRTDANDSEESELIQSLKVVDPLSRGNIELCQK